MDQSHLDQKVWSQQILCNGSFENCQKILQLFEENRNNFNSLLLLREIYHFHTKLREKYIACHSIHPLVSTICHEVFFVGQRATQLWCNHFFQMGCIFLWFKSRLSCTLCRDELM